MYALIYLSPFFFFYKLPFILQLSTARFENKLSSLKKRKKEEEEEAEKYNNRHELKRYTRENFFPSNSTPPLFLSLVIGLNLDGLNHAPAPRFPSSFPPSSPLPAVPRENLMNLSRQ